MSQIPEEYKGRDLGQLAEDTLRLWISGKSSITLNEVRKDKEGWDVLLEFPFLEPDEGMPWDTAAPRIQCFLQVKGKDIKSQKQKQRDVKLNNWQKLIYTPLPAFFLVYEYDGDSLQQAYILHVNDNWMEKVLRRLRMTRKGDSVPLHKKNVALSWNINDSLNELNADSLILKMIDFIGDDFDAYIISKQEKRKELGLDAPFLINVTNMEYSSEEEMYKELVDFSIGKSEKLPTNSITIQKDVRFGTPAETEDRGEGIISISPTGTPIDLIFRNKSGSTKVAFSATAYGPDFFFPNSELPDKYRKYRIEYPLGELIYLPPEAQKIYGRSETINLDLDPSNEYRDIQEMVNAWRIISLLNSASRDGLDVEIKLEGVPPIRIGFFVSGEVPKTQKIIAKAVENAWFVVRLFDLPMNLVVTLEEIANQQQIFADVRMFLDPTDPPIRSITGSLIEPTDHPDKEHAIVFTRVLKLGDLSILIAVGMAGPIILYENGTQFEIRRPKRVHAEHFILSEGEKVKDAVKTVYNQLNKKDYEIIEYQDNSSDEEE